MMERKENERGAIMVEVLAVIALLGTMGTLLFRQVIQRNQELDNINIATEMRILKEGFLAYINADKAVLETDCPLVDGEPARKCAVDEDSLRESVRDFVPDGYAAVEDEGDVLDMYDFYLFGYQVSGRKYFYGIIVPKTGSDGPLPEAMKLTQAARVANLIGSDGGIYTNDSSGEGYLNGTMGGWRLPCDGVCPTTLPPGTSGIPVVLTGIDVYVPEPDIKDDARIPVAVPESIAFRRLHSSEYFSVGNSNDNCIEVCDDPDNPGTKVLCHTIVENNAAKEDIIYGPGGLKSGAAASNKCDPLFWVGTVTNTDTDKSSAGHVYIKNNLYVGRDNENERQAVAIETDDESDAGRQIRVYNIDGTERLTLNAAGHVIARDSDGGETVRIDGGNGIITTYQKRHVGGDINKNIYVPTLRIGGGQIISNQQAILADGENGKKRSYKLDLANVSLLNDVRLTSRGGAKLSEILPNYIAKNMHSLSFTESNPEEKTVEKPDCPAGYSRAIVVTPTKWAQYVQGVELNMEHKYDNNEQYSGYTRNVTSTTGDHNHPFNVDAPDAHTINANTIGTDTNNIVVQDTITNPQVRLIQKAPIQIDIDSEDNNWKVTMTYGGNAPSENGKDDIAALAQTYCVFEKDAFSSGGTSDSALNSGLYREQGESAPPDALTPEASDQEDYVGNKEETSTCSDDWDCLNTESCNSGKCELRGTCSQDDGVSTGTPHEYCIEYI